MLFQSKPTDVFVFHAGENPGGFSALTLRPNVHQIEAKEPSWGQLPPWLLTSLKHIKSSVTSRSIPTESVDAHPLGRRGVGVCLHQTAVDCLCQCESSEPEIWTDQCLLCQSQ